MEEQRPKRLLDQVRDDIGTVQPYLSDRTGRSSATRTSRRPWSAPTSSTGGVGAQAAIVSSLLSSFCSSSTPHSIFPSSFGYVSFHL